MKFTKINKKNRDVISKFYSNINKESLLDADYKLMDKAPNDSYYSYYITNEEQTCRLFIDYSENTITIEQGYNNRYTENIE